MKQLPLLFHFYRNYVAFAGLLISVVCWYLCYGHGSDTIAVLTCFKIITDVAIYYIIGAARNSRMIYYYNRHLAKTMLWSFALITDLLIFIIGLWISLIAR